MLSLMVAAGISSSVAAGAPLRSLTASDVRRIIRTEGARAAARVVFDDRSAERTVLAGIGTGGSGWLRVAEALRPVSDGAASEGLCVAIQDALPRNPAGVLKLVQKGSFDLTAACGGYGAGQIEDARPLAVILRLVEARIAAVTGVVSPSLASERSACLKALVAQKARLAQR